MRTEDVRSVPDPVPGRQNLLPHDAYPPEFDEETRRRVDRRLRALQSRIPDRPGRYVDRDGDPWTAHADGSWTDKNGEWREAAYTPLLGLWAPWTRVTPRWNRRRRTGPESGAVSRLDTPRIGVDAPARTTGFTDGVHP